jgi:NAD(P)-dependent dehydrogenase (short-subunit alcohol dehydrogenase family)
MATVVVSGSAGGMGTAIRKRLEGAGDRVIGIDRVDAEVVVDLESPAARGEAIREVLRHSGGIVDGVVAAAGVLFGPGSRMVSVNYFAAVQLVEGLREALTGSVDPTALVFSSNSATTHPGYPLEVTEACLAGDERAAREIGDVDYGVTAYPATKLALARWARRAAPEWMRAGICLNIILPGLTATPMVADHIDQYLTMDAYPIPAARPGTPDEIAGLVQYLLGPDARFFSGSVLCMDGGSEAALRPDDWPTIPPAAGQRA